VWNLPRASRSEPGEFRDGIEVSRWVVQAGPTTGAGAAMQGSLTAIRPIGRWDPRAVRRLLACWVRWGRRQTPPTLRVEYSNAKLQNVRRKSTAMSLLAQRRRRARRQASWYLSFQKPP